MAGEQQSTAPSPNPKSRPTRKTRRLPPYNVVILNDEEHTFPYVIELLIKLFRHDLPKAEELTWRIHTTGRAVVYTTHKELAELQARPGHRLRRRPAPRNIPRARCAAMSSRRRWIDRAVLRDRFGDLAITSRTIKAAGRPGRDVRIDQLEPSPAFIR